MNSALTAKLVAGLFLLQPAYYNDLQDAVPYITQVLVELRRRAQEGSAEEATMTREELVDMHSYLLDIIVTVS
jgi:hypothetical protein